VEADHFGVAGAACSLKIPSESNECETESTRYTVTVAPWTTAVALLSRLNPVPEKLVFVASSHPTITNDISTYS
jgi:hypothetical protein